MKLRKAALSSNIIGAASVAPYEGNMQYENIEKIAELENEVRELKSQAGGFQNALQRIQLGNDVVSSEIARQALVMGAM